METGFGLIRVIRVIRGKESSQTETKSWDSTVENAEGHGASVSTETALPCVSLHSLPCYLPTSSRAAKIFRQP
jgi:hypothetical protein